MANAERTQLLHELTNEVMKDNFDTERVKDLMGQLRIPYSEDPMQLLNNILKGIHIEDPKNDKLV